MSVEPRTFELSDPEDRKLLTLARSTRTRTRAREGACVRDTDGRTYAAATVDLSSLQLSAVQVAVAMAACSAAAGIEAVAVLTESPRLNEADLAVVRDFSGSGVSVFALAPDGAVTQRVLT